MTQRQISPYAAATAVLTATLFAVTALLFAGLPLSAQARFEVPNNTGTSWYQGYTHTH